ncbi:MAG: hypothetical protein KBT21_08660 [Treponema sp.]|nr:hypothetical protein [Candidatus Treponema merdequi]
MKNEIKIFLSGVGSAFIAVILFLFRRKKDMADNGRVQLNHAEYDDCTKRVERLETESEERIERTENAINSTIGILKKARERAEKENSSL